MRFVKRWLGDTQPSAGTTVPAVPAGRRIYCIGDIHGRADLLQDLQRRVVADAADFTGQAVLIYLGDYIDRGLESRTVVELLYEGPPGGFEAVYLMGNHEQTLLDFLRHPREVASWLIYGGRETLFSYGVDPGAPGGRQDLEALRDALEARLPRHHLEFFESCRFLHQEGDYCFVHAGIRPGVALGDQRNEDLLWIRQDFTESEVDHGMVVVHGHSIEEEVAMRPNRIGIDTGAFYTGVLTCLVLEGEERRLLQTGRLHA